MMLLWCSLTSSVVDNRISIRYSAISNSAVRWHEIYSPCIVVDKTSSLSGIGYSHKVRYYLKYLLLNPTGYLLFIHLLVFPTTHLYLPGYLFVAIVTSVPVWYNYFTLISFINQGTFHWEKHVLMNVKFLRNSQVPFAFYWSFSRAADGSPNDCSEDMCTMGPCLLVKLRKKVSGTDRWMVSKAEQRPRNIMRSLQSLRRGCSLLQSTLKARGFGASFHLWYFFTLKFMTEMYDRDIQWWLPNQYQRTLKSILT